MAVGRPNDNELIADTWIDEANLDKQWGVSFRTMGKVGFRVGSAYSTDILSAERVYIGQQGAHPQGLSFSLSRDTQDVAGTQPFQPGAQAGIYIGLTAPDTWQVFVSGARDPTPGGKTKPQQIAFKVISTEPITEVTAIGDPAKSEHCTRWPLPKRAAAVFPEAESTVRS